MEKGQRNRQSDTKKGLKGKSKWAKREARMKKVKDEEIEMSEVNEKILNVSFDVT